MRAGETVTIVVDVSCLGLSPLGGERLWLEIEIENGIVENAGTDGLGAVTVTILPTKTLVSVSLGELGPARGKLGHVEGTVILAKATGAPGSSLQVRTNLQDEEPGAWPEIEYIRKQHGLEINIDE